ncbi:MAG: hypothetical protein GVY36_11920 [Verrucomicrobia bacterium]|jgi:hypothetical protein|nr:hypothetical protein [Verrucomicrobiota bacterium]
MTKRVLPNDQASLNAAADNGQINYFITPPELADYYFAKITNANVSGFRGKLLDYYIEATDTRGNVHKSEIQHVFVEDDGSVSEPPATPATPDLDPDELMEFPIATLRDSIGSGTFDRLDPGRAFRIRSLTPSGTTNELTVPVIPGRSYQVLSSPDLSPDSWIELTNFIAAPGEEAVTIQDTANVGATQHFYKIKSFQAPSLP